MISSEVTAVENYFYLHPLEEYYNHQWYLILKEENKQH